MPATIFLLACSGKDEPTDPNLLPEREHPVEFTGFISHYSVASEDIYSLSSLHQYQVESTTNGDWNDAHSGSYRLSGQRAKLELVGSDKAYWTRRDEVRQVRGWVAPGGITPAQLPRRWSVEADQKSGLDKHMLLYGHSEMRYGETNELIFHHQLSKIKVNVKFSGSASEHYAVTDILIGHDNVALSGDFTAPVDKSDYGTWETDTSTAATIMPHPFTSFVDCSYSAEALVIPQPVPSEDLLTVRISDGTELRWSADEAGAEWRSGAVTVYDATVSEDLKSMRVTCHRSGGWVEGADENVTARPSLPDYGAVKVGDYFYDDGSWSDGGFMGYDLTGHGSVVWKSPKPLPTGTNPITGKGRRVVGVVFCTDNARIGAAEKSALDYMGVDVHGLVISTTPITGVQWDSTTSDDTAIGISYIKGDTERSLYELANSSISGLAVMKALCDNRGAQLRNGRYGAFAATIKLAAPQYTTGWYVPTGGQWFDMLRNFTGMDFSDKSPFYFPSNQVESNDGMHFDWQLDMTLAMQKEYDEDIVELLNSAFAGIDTEDVSPFAENENYYTANVCDASNAYYTNVLPKFITFRRAAKTYWLNVRPVLAF